MCVVVMGRVGPGGGLLRRARGGGVGARARPVAPAKVAWLHILSGETC